jgi:hypothetical protein
MRAGFLEADFLVVLGMVIYTLTLRGQLALVF